MSTSGSSASASDSPGPDSPAEADDTPWDGDEDATPVDEAALPANELLVEASNESTRIALVWADLGEDAGVEEWYATSFMPANAARLGTHSRLAETLKENIFKEMAVGLKGKYLTAYGIPDGMDVKEVDRLICPSPHLFAPQVRLETRCYKEYATWFGDEWRDEVRDTVLWTVIVWQPLEQYREEFVAFFKDEFAPGMLESPELLRVQIFKLEHASKWEQQTYQHVNPAEMYQYITIWEFSSNELPWEILVYLGSSEEWRYHVEGQHLDWQTGMYRQIVPMPIDPDLEDDEEYDDDEDEDESDDNNNNGHQGREGDSRNGKGAEKAVDVRNRDRNISHVDSRRRSRSPAASP